MSKDQRRTRRRPLKRPAWIALAPDDLRECILFDVSDEGARIEIDDTRDIPDQFVLFLSINGAARRNCQAVWREGRQIGVRVRKATDLPTRKPPKGARRFRPSISNEPAETA